MTEEDKALQNRIIRCEWLNEDPIYIKYHDEEWGKPEYDSVRLFEMLCLEGQQAGLSWITILKKRKNYKKLFYNFDPYKISTFRNNDVNKLLQDSSIVKHKGKIHAIVNNSKCYVQMKNNNEDFSTFIWSFVGNNPLINNWKSCKDIPNKTPTSVELSKALKKRGFKYVGPTICYAFMEACGLVNDHIISCFYR